MFSCSRRSEENYVSKILFDTVVVVILILTASSVKCFVFLIQQCANIGPADYNYDETISTLRYANRAKNIKNKARINEDPKDALLRQFQKEIEELKKKLEEGNFFSKY